MGRDFQKNWRLSLGLVSRNRVLKKKLGFQER